MGGVWGVGVCVWGGGGKRGDVGVCLYIKKK